MSLQSLSLTSLSSGSSSNKTSDGSVRGTTTAESDASTRAGAKQDIAALEREGRDITSGKPSQAEEDMQNGTTRKLKHAEVANREQRRDAINGSNIKSGKQERVVVIIDNDDDDVDTLAVQEAAKKRIKLSSDGDAAEMAVALTHHNGLLKQGGDHHASLAELKNREEPALTKTILPPIHQELHRSSPSRMSSPSNIPKTHQSQPQQPPFPRILPQDVIEPSPGPSETAGAASLGSLGRKEWTSGMYLDFCLMLQRSFDFNAFAAKYDIPVGKVLDRFQALVLHPLMNHNEKGRMRVVEGSRARVKEWSDAKKETRKRMREEREEAEETVRGEE